MSGNDIDFTWLIGQSVTEINHMYPILIFDESWLMIECPWRLRTEENIVLGSVEYDYEKYKDWTHLKLEKYLLNHKITKVEFNSNTADLVISFHEQFILELFHVSSHFEGWQLSGPNGYLLVSTPGGYHSFWPEGCEK